VPEPLTAIGSDRAAGVTVIGRPAEGTCRAVAGDNPPGALGAGQGLAQRHAWLAGLAARSLAARRPARRSRRPGT